MAHRTTMRSPKPLLCLLLTTLPTLLPAQQPIPSQLPHLPELVPIHTGPDDAAGHGPYGTWAAGPTFKASFHGGFTFYPWIPAAEVTRGWSWRTADVSVGETSLALDAAQMAVTDPTRCEYRHGPVTEVYDLRREGVEQSFVIHALPARSGDIVVTGQVTTPFRADARPPLVGAIDFHDLDGSTVLRYGAATAFDANGASTPVRTSIQAGLLRLVVDAAFVRTAQLPITIDPLTSATALVANTYPVGSTCLAAGTPGGNKRVLIASTRVFSATDHDVFAYRFDEDTLTYTQMLLDIATANSATKVDIAECAGSLTFVYIVQRDYAASPTVSTTFVQSQSGSLNIGTALSLPSGYSDPQIGGCRQGGTKALVVSTQTLASGSRRVRGNVLDTQPVGLGASFDLHSFASAADSFDPAVTDAAVGTGAWGVAWISAFGATAGDDIRCAEISQSGTPTTTRVLVVKPGAREPRLAGATGRYLATFLHTPAGTFGRLSSLRYDIAATLVVPGAERTITTANQISSQLAIGDVAYDHFTQSHWASTYRTRNQVTGSSSAFVLRHGYTGGVVESASLHPSTSDGVGNASTAFLGLPGNGAVEAFAVAYSTATTSPGYPLWYRRLDSGAAFSTYGTSCRPNAPVSNHLPFAGSQFFSFGVQGLPANAVAIALLGGAMTNVPLASAGMPGCSLLVGYDVNPVAIANALGDASVVFSLPDSPAFLGNFYGQWAWLEAGANPLGLVTGLAAQLVIQ